MMAMQIIVDYWSKIGMSDDAINQYVDQCQDLIESEGDYYYNYSLTSHVQLFVIERYKESFFFDKTKKSTADEIDKISFVQFCMKMGTIKAAAESWFTKFMDIKMDIYPKIYIFALLHGLSIKCCAV
jgi:hypothetical protein